MQKSESVHGLEWFVKHAIAKNRGTWGRRHSQMENSDLAPRMGFPCESTKSLSESNDFISRVPPCRTHWGSGKGSSRMQIQGGYRWRYGCACVSGMVVCPLFFLLNHQGSGTLKKDTLQYLVHSCTSCKRGEERQVRLLHFELASDCEINNERITNRANGPCKATAENKNPPDNEALLQVQDAASISVASLARLENQAPCPCMNLKVVPG